MLDVIDLTNSTALRGASCALGNFDGLHLGHQDVLDAARIPDHPLAMMTFAPYPREYFKPDAQAFRLTPLACQIRVAQALGVERLYIVPFTKLIADMTPDEFVGEILVKRAGIKRLSVGENFHFGANREGDSRKLKQLAGQHDIQVSQVPLKKLNGEIVSSSSIRNALTTGNPKKAASLLGRWFEVEGSVQHGDKRGRTLGYPTLNISLGTLMQPQFGVYAVRVKIDSDWYDGVASLGIRPMFRLKEPLLEVHVFNFDQEIYGKVIRVALRHWLRPEQSFADMDILMNQMDADSQRAKQVLNSQDNPWEKKI